MGADINEVIKMFFGMNTALSDNFFLDRVELKEELDEKEKERVHRILEPIKNQYWNKEKCICGGHIRTTGTGEHWSIDCSKCDYLFMED